MNKNIVISKCERVQNNPFMDLPMDHWRLTLFNKATQKQMTLTYSQGYGFNGQRPNVERIIETLKNDSYMASMDYQDFLNETNLENSSLSRKRYAAIFRQTEGLKRITEE